MYWSDGQLLDAVGGDFTVIENLRVIDKAARMVRIMLIGLVGDRRFNSTANGKFWALRKLTRPLRIMSKAVEFNGMTFPAEIQPPHQEDIAISWVTRDKVEIYMVVRPYTIPKNLTANIMLDLSNPE